MVNQQKTAPPKRARNVSSARPRWPSVMEFTVKRNDWPQTSERMARQANDNLGHRQLETFYALHEVQKHWGISLTTLYREIERKALKAIKIGGQWRLSESSLNDYLKTREKCLRLPGRARRKAS